jgi:hypothetical protein
VAVEKWRRRRSGVGLSLLAGVAAFLLSLSSAFADDFDTVLLKNGGRLRGKVMEEDPKSGVSIKLIDGVVKRVRPDEVKSVEYAASVAPPLPAPPSPGPPPPAVPVAAIGAPLPALAVEPAPAARSGASSGLMVAGLVTLGTGAVAVGVGSVLITTASSDGQQTAGIASAIAGGGTATIGLVLLIVGMAVRPSAPQLSLDMNHFKVEPNLGFRSAGMKVAF